MCTAAKVLTAAGVFACQVILTAPGKGVTTVVSGVNDDRVDDSVNIFAAASCTTNAIVPLLKAMHETYGVEVRDSLVAA